MRNPNKADSFEDVLCLLPSDLDIYHFNTAKNAQYFRIGFLYTDTSHRYLYLFRFSFRIFLDLDFFNFSIQTGLPGACAPSSKTTQSGSHILPHVGL